MRLNARRCITVILAAAALGTQPAFSGDAASTQEGSVPHNDKRCPIRQGEAGTGMGWFAPGAGWLAGLDELGLTADQRDAIRKITESYRTRGWDLAQRAAGIREQFSRVAPNDPGYADATQKASETAAVLASDLVKMIADARAEIHAVLTDEQRQHLRDRLDSSQKRWEEWRSRHQAPQ